ncbi:MAG: 3-dehydroquinate synthase [Bdellovibrionales bacterium]|nr:3-dehydroquinate synthase [Bdellovibrionales bacterium]
MESTFQWNAKTKVEFLKKLPSRERMAESLGFKPEKFVVIYDKRLAKHEGFAKWIGDFTMAYPVGAGERLKEVVDLPSHLKKLMKIMGPFSSKSLALVSVGGGSVGDFAGFVASVLKRGVPFIQIPSTLLAAMDSAHGGKTALNMGEVKNQIGTFYPADSVMIVKSLFEGLPALQLQSAGGELAKMALLEGGTLYDKFKAALRLDFETIWNLLPEAIEAKYKVVERDPFEKNGERQMLNLGHSLGHALESYYGLAHGVAVGQGLIFAAQWSAHQGYWRDPREALELLQGSAGFLPAKEFVKKHRAMSRSKLSRYISEDKKLTDTRHLTFVFLEGVGKPFRKVVTLESFLTETQRQGWTYV